jgi:hypothetical protein
VLDVAPEALAWISNRASAVFGEKANE